MAKQGFSYYKAETDRFQDIKIKRLKKKYHCTGYAVYQYVLNEIYRVRGYFLQFTEDHLFDVSEYWDIDEELVTEIIGYCAEIGLFSAQLWQERSVLTACSIQARYIDICKVCKKTVAIEDDLRLVPAEQAAAAPPPMPSLFADEGRVPMRIVSGGAAPAAKPTAQAAPPPPRAAQPETAVQGVAAQVLAQLAEQEAQSLPEVSENLPETSGNTPEESDKVINSYTETKPSSYSPREEEAKASLASGENRLRLLLQSVGCLAADWQWISTIDGIDTETSPIWQLVEELKASGGRYTFSSYVMPSLRSLVASGRLRIRPQTRDVTAELRKLLQSVQVPSYDIDKVLRAAQGQEQVLREAIAEVKKSKGKITMPARYLLAKLRAAAPAEAS